LSAKSMEAAADTLRGLDVTLPSALRWLHRRVRAVQVVHDAVSRLCQIDILVSGSMGPNDPGERHVLFGFVARYRRCCCTAFRRRWASNPHDVEDGHVTASNTT
jgi:hypothetical protein